LVGDQSVITSLAPYLGSEDVPLLVAPFKDVAFNSMMAHVSCTHVLAYWLPDWRSSGRGN
jgi:hypothetical protein